MFQVETTNPHFHEDRGSDHLEEMGTASLSAMYHSPAATSQVRALIREHTGSEPPSPTPPYPPLTALDPDPFRTTLIQQGETFSQIVDPDTGAHPPIAEG